MRLVKTALMCLLVGVIMLTPYTAHSHYTDLIDDISSKEFTALRRGEFEKLADYKKRLGDFKRQVEVPIAIELPFKGGSSFTEPGNNSFKANYLIDNEILEFSLRSSGYYPDFDHRFEGLPKGEEITFYVGGNTKRDTYIGENSFGVKKTINKTKQNAYYIVVTNTSLLSKYYKKSDYFYKLVFKSKCPPDEAKLVKDNLNLVLRLSVVPTPYGKNTKSKKSLYVAWDHSHHTPTISEPYDEEKREKFLHVRLVSLEIVEPSTKKVYISIKNKNELQKK